MTSKEKEVFCSALDALKANGTIDALASLHQSSPTTAQIHQRNMFLPWHRWFIAEFERSLKGTSVVGASKITLPYWDWTSEFFPGTTTAPGDNSRYAPLWDPTFLGKYDSQWGLQRRSDNSTLSFGTTISAVEGNTNFDNFRYALENNLHGSPHIWVGGLMGGGSSPADPVFYLHHNMVDKIWQNWLDLGGGRVSGPFYKYETTKVADSMPTYPQINPYNIVDSRSPLLKVWFAENGTVLLNNYTVAGQESYRYTGVVKSEAFTVPSGTTCTFHSGKEIELKAGFGAASGCTLNAYIDLNYFNTTREEDIEIADENNAFEETESSSAFSENDLIVSPNPSSDAFNVLLLTNDKVDCQYALYNSLGEIIMQKSGNINKYFNIDLSKNPKGIYILNIAVNNKSYIKKLVLN
ncbi:MAG TPA: tyrosinase family protein [Cytophagaceae bacterium]